MTNAKNEYFKVNPTYDVVMWTETWFIDVLDEASLYFDVELSIVESGGKQGIIRTIVDYFEDESSHSWEEGLYPCVYDKVTPLGCVAGVGLFKLQEGNESKIVLMKVASYPGGDEIICFEAKE